MKTEDFKTEEEEKKEKVLVYKNDDDQDAMKSDVETKREVILPRTVPSSSGETSLKIGATSLQGHYPTGGGGLPISSSMSLGPAGMLPMPIPANFLMANDENEYLLPPGIVSIGPNPPWLHPRFMPTSYKIGWRKGKWLDEEEAYTKKLIEAFNAGYLNLPSGTTLRSFLSERLSW